MRTSHHLWLAPHSRMVPFAVVHRAHRRTSSGSHPCPSFRPFHIDDTPAVFCGDFMATSYSLASVEDRIGDFPPIDQLKQRRILHHVVGPNQLRAQGFQLVRTSAVGPIIVGDARSRDVFVVDRFGALALQSTPATPGERSRACPSSNRKTRELPTGVQTQTNRDRYRGLHNEDHTLRSPPRSRSALPEPCKIRPGAPDRRYKSSAFRQVSIRLSLRLASPLRRARVGAGVFRGRAESPAAAVTFTTVGGAADTRPTSVNENQTGRDRPSNPCHR